ncbi:MAG: hypothetical protein CM1200mP38_8430 [Dehalococcoidia bacterium]|nr:MAG: hypothetical protein CM1200mP38_8430 [Dehalococcoidia bacterium]
MCGNETPTQWKSLNTNVIKQLKIPPSIAEELTIDEEMIIRDAEMIYSSGAKILIDADVPKGKHGGTGVLPHWDLASKISAKYPPNFSRRTNTQKCFECNSSGQSLGSRRIKWSRIKQSERSRKNCSIH